MSRIRRIMYATDFSRASQAAFAKALEITRSNRAELTVIHVFTLIPPFAVEGAYVSPKTWGAMEASARAGAQKQLDALVARAERAGLRARSLIVVGNPYEQIVRAARLKRADMLVIGTHGRTGLGKFLLGSVAERVLSMAGCPVLTVRGHGA
jgi:nucleotide-binding universal stress UspA family protein